MQQKYNNKELLIMQRVLLDSPWIYHIYKIFDTPTNMTHKTWFQKENIAKRTTVPRHWVVNSFTTFCSQQKIQQALKSWSNSLVLFGKGWRILRDFHVSILTNTCNNIKKSNNSDKSNDVSKIKKEDWLYTRQWGFIGGKNHEINWLCAFQIQFVDRLKKTHYRNSLPVFWQREIYRNIKTI